MFGEYKNTTDRKTFDESIPCGGKEIFCWKKTPMGPSESTIPAADSIRQSPDAGSDA